MSPTHFLMEVVPECPTISQVEVVETLDGHVLCLKCKNTTCEVENSLYCEITPVADT